MTQIGEKGSSLSVGQKARISMARAVYANKDIILMDDPLSALDVHTKKQVFEQVLSGMLRYKTRILITHAIDLLDKVDRVIVVKQGRIIHQGHFDQLKNLDYFQTMLNNI